MKVISGIGKLKKIKRAVVALGVFDGLHAGHMRLLREVIARAKKINGKSVVVTFYPHPQKESFIYSLDHRIKLLRQVGIDICVWVDFTKSFSKVTATDFVEKILVKKINPRVICVGENFTFGRGAEGNVSLLKKLSLENNFDLKVFPLYKLQGKIVSSTNIRRFITSGRLKEAEKLLSRRVSILGRVFKERGVASSLGFPTANLKIYHEVLPATGIYQVLVNLDKRVFKGVCYIGSRPTFKNKKKSFGRIHVEVHLFGFSGNLYGKELEVLFIKKIREDKKFSEISSLVEEIKNDIAKVKENFRIS